MYQLETSVNFRGFVMESQMYPKIVQLGSYLLTLQDKLLWASAMQHQFVAHLATAHRCTLALRHTVVIGVM